MSQTLLHPRLSVSQMTTYRWSLEDDIIQRRRAGIDSIGIWRPKLAEMGEEKAVDLIADSGLGVSSLSWAGGFTGSHGYTFDQAVEDGYEALELATRLNAECLVIVSGTVSGHINKHARRLLVEGLLALADVAQALGVKLALQPMHSQYQREWTFLSSLDAAIDVVEECNHPFVGLSLNSYHLRDEPDLANRLPSIAAKVHHVQLCDGLPHEPSEFDRYLPGDGEIQISELVHALRDAGYSGAYEIDVWSESVWESFEFELLEECRERFSRLWTDVC